VLLLTRAYRAVAGAPIVPVGQAWASDGRVVERGPDFTVPGGPVVARGQHPGGALACRVTAQEAARMNNTNILKLVACLSWAGVAVSSATSANAFAFTTQSGNYASCSNDFSYYARQVCEVNADYTQNIKFVSTACSSGAGCSSDTGIVYTTMLYWTGRKSTTSFGVCELNFYGLDTCAC
jgi:hypothetical protein